MSLDLFARVRQKAPTHAFKAQFDQPILLDLRQVARFRGETWSFARPEVIMKRHKILIILFCLNLISCTHLFEGRQFISEMDRESDSFLVPGRDFRTVPGDSGQAYRTAEEIMERTPANYRTKEEYEYQRSLMDELQWRENQLTEIEMARYRQVGAYLPSESEKIYYLSLSPYERDSYIQSKSAEVERNVRAPASMGRPSLFTTHETTSIALGMDKDRVLGVFGHPSRVDVAGNPAHENERWAFVENGRVRYVYFEAGVVQGWALD